MALSTVSHSRTMRHAAQFTALVDILFATIGIFVIVFALQDISSPADLQPAPYDRLLVCRDDRSLNLYSPNDEPRSFVARDINGSLSEALAGTGRILVAFAGSCAVDDGNGLVLIDRLLVLEQTLGERPMDGQDPLTLFEFAPLGSGQSGPNALIERFEAIHAMEVQ